MIKSGMAAVFAATLAASAPADAAPKAAAPAAEVVTHPAVVAQSNPISGVGIVIKRHPPGNNPKRTVSGGDGSFRFEGLQPGSYEVVVSGQPPSTITVGADGQIAGIVTARGVEYTAKAGKSGSTKN